MARTITRIGPADHGRRMSLDEFDLAEAQEGHLYELSRGVVTVSDVPNQIHFGQVDSLRQELAAYRVTHPQNIFRVAGGSECKILLHALGSERHPDVAVYQHPPKGDEDLWATWIPELVIEVVSPGSEERDYKDKREEYFLFGIREYWIIDADKEQVLVLSRVGGRWKERTVKPPELYQTGLLPGFTLDCAKVFEAARGG